MPPPIESSPETLEMQCIFAYLKYLYDEVSLLLQMKSFERRSLVLKSCNLKCEELIKLLDVYFSRCVKGILQDLVRQKMLDIVIANAHNAESDALFLMTEPDKLLHKGSSSKDIQYGDLFNRAKNPVPKEQIFRNIPIVRLFELLLHKDLKTINFALNKKLKDTERLQDFSRILWKLISEKCYSLEKLIISKELCYSSTLTPVIRNNQHLTHLTLKRNVPNNMFLSVIASSCPNLQELDIAGADIVTDFGMICLIFTDPEQIMEECWNKEKTTQSTRRSTKAFPHSHFDKPIPDPVEIAQSSLPFRNSSNFLHLKRSFHEVVTDKGFEWSMYPIRQSLRKIRLENTKVKGDGASVILETCPKLNSMGYLVFAAAGLKQVYGCENQHKTNFEEIFYRGPSDQKLVTISNCCPKLSTFFLGSNIVRKMTAEVFTKWQQLTHLTLENIFSVDVLNCLDVIGVQLKGLKIQCCGFDLADIASRCPNLETFVIQKETPKATIHMPKNKCIDLSWKKLAHVELTCSNFSRECFLFIIRIAVNLKTFKAFEVNGLHRDDIDKHFTCQTKLEKLIFFRTDWMTIGKVESILDSLPRLRVFGDLRSLNPRNANELKLLQVRIKAENWDCKLIDSIEEAPMEKARRPLGSTANPNEEKEFGNHLSLHWFYLTEISESTIDDSLL